MKRSEPQPALLILNQMAGPMTWELAEDFGRALGCVALLTGHPDTLAKQDPHVLLYPAAAYRRGSFARRALTWLHYWLQAFVWLCRWPAETPLLLFSNPPILCWLGWVMRKLRGSRYSVMVHDIYPDVLVRMSGFRETHPLIRLWRRFNRHAYERADVVMTLGEFMAQTLGAQFDPARTPAGRIEVIYPWVDTDRIKPLPKAENPFAIQHGQVDKLTVMYSGNMGLGHDIETMLEAARRLQGEPRIHFMFIGAGPKWQLVQQTLQTERLPNVTLLGWQPEETLPYSLAAADIAFVSLENGMEGLAVPSKAFSSLAAGTPLAVLANINSELMDLVTRYCCGWCLTLGEVDALDELLRHIVNDPASLVRAKHNSLEFARLFGSRANSQRIVDIALGVMARHSLLLSAFRHAVSTDPAEFVDAN